MYKKYPGAQLRKSAVGLSYTHDVSVEEISKETDGIIFLSPINYLLLIYHCYYKLCKV